MIKAFNTVHAELLNCACVHVSRITHIRQSVRCSPRVKQVNKPLFWVNAINKSYKTTWKIRPLPQAQPSVVSVLRSLPDRTGLQTPCIHCILWLFPRFLGSLFPSTTPTPRLRFEMARDYSSWVLEQTAVQANQTCLCTYRQLLMIQYIAKNKNKACHKPLYAE